MSDSQQTWTSFLSMEPQNLRQAVEALTRLGYRPRAPVVFDEFLDAAKRREWAQKKNMTVFSLFSDSHQATEIDVFLEVPIDFDIAYARAFHQEVAPGNDSHVLQPSGLDQTEDLVGPARRCSGYCQTQRLRKRIAWIEPTKANLTSVSNKFGRKVGKTTNGAN
jgi:hypothetical protein